MHASKLLPLLAVYSGLSSAAAIEQPTPAIKWREPMVEERAAPTCGSRPVNVVYEVLKALRASAFCTQFNQISTQTQSSVLTATTVTTTTTSVTEVSVVLATTTTTTTTEVTATKTSTSTAPAVTSTTPIVTTVFSSVTFKSTVRTTTTSTSTTYIYDVEDKKRDLHARDLQDRAPKKPKELIAFADNVISSACSCYATTPTVTRVATTTSVGTLTETDTVTNSETSVIATNVYVETSTVTSITVFVTTPIVLITTTSTLSLPTTVATAITSVTATDIRYNFVNVILIPVVINGCKVINSGPKFTNLGNSLSNAAKACAPHCIQAGRTVCDDFFISQNLPSGTFDCFLLSQAQEANTNFVCGQANIGEAAEVIIIY